MDRILVRCERASSTSWKKEDPDVRRPNSLLSASVLRSGGGSAFVKTGLSNPCPGGGSTSPLEKYSRQILALISEESGLTLNEIVSALHKRRIPGSRSALSRFFARHGITIKKSLQAAERKRA